MEGKEDYNIIIFYNKEEYKLCYQRSYLVLVHMIICLYGFSGRRPTAYYNNNNIIITTKLNTAITIYYNIVAGAVGKLNAALVSRPRNNNNILYRYSNSL